MVFTSWAEKLCSLYVLFLILIFFLFWFMVTSYIIWTNDFIPLLYSEFFYAAPLLFCFGEGHDQKTAETLAETPTKPLFNNWLFLINDSTIIRGYHILIFILISIYCFFWISSIFHNSMILHDFRWFCPLFCQQPAPAPAPIPITTNDNEAPPPPHATPCFFMTCSVVPWFSVMIFSDFSCYSMFFVTCSGIFWEFSS